MVSPVPTGDVLLLTMSGHAVGGMFALIEWVAARMFVRSAPPVCVVGVSTVRKMNSASASAWP